MSLHHFTVDVEEYFHVAALAHWIPRSSWERRESRLGGALTWLLDALERHGARGTFFVLGWVAERHPELVREIAHAGHEVASHGLDHVRVTAQDARQFRASVRRTKQLLEDITAAPVHGFRAPNFSIVPGRECALDVLVEEGYLYDSSLFPVRRPGYGYPGARRDPYWLERAAGRLAEFPPATLCMGAVCLPAAGGAYFRLFPYALVRAALRQSEARGAPGTIYIHPWELDPDQPRLPVPWLVRLRHYGGLEGTRERLRRLLREFRFVPIAETLRRL